MQHFQKHIFVGCTLKEFLLSETELQYLILKKSNIWKHCLNKSQYVPCLVPLNYNMLYVECQLIIISPLRATFVNLETDLLTPAGEIIYLFT